MRNRAIVAMLLVMSGCSFFSRSKSNFFSLDRFAGPVVNVRGLPVGIDSIELPPGVDRGEIMVRTANDKDDVRSSDQWTATFSQLVLHTLASDLADRLPQGMVVFPGEAKPLAMRSIDLAFEELAAGPDNKVTADAQWVLHEKGRPDVAHHERIAIDIPSLDSANVAAGMSRALATLADRIAAGL